MSEFPSPSTTQRPRWGTATKLVVAVLLLLGAVALFQRVPIIVPPVILAAILAFVLNPIVSFFHRRARIPRSLVLVLIYLVLIALLSIVVATVAPPLIGQIQNLMAKVPAILRDIESGLEGRVALGPLSVDLSGLLDGTEELLLNTVQSIGSESINFLGSVLTSVAELGVTAVFTFIISFYLVKDGHQALDWAYRVAPPALVSDLRRLLGEISLIWGGFFRGQIVLGMVGGLIVGTGSAIIGLPMPLLMGVLAGLLELLPSLGHGIWLVIAVPLALFSGSTWQWMPLSHFWFAVLLVALHSVYQQVDLNYLIPRIIGRRVHLHPLIVIMGILVGASVGGVLGVFLAAPTIASLRVLGRYVYANLLDVDPFPSGLADEEEE